MLTNYYENPHALDRARTSASGPYLGAFAHELMEAGYASETIRQFLRTATHLGLWIEREGASIQALDAVSIERFRLHLAGCRCPAPRRRRRRSRQIAAQAARFLEHLRDDGVVSPEACPTVDTHPVRAGFHAWMRQHRGATPTTLRIYGRVVAEALAALGNDPTAFDARALREFV